MATKTAQSGSDTIETGRGTETAAAQECANCGMPRDDWETEDGFTNNGQTYCCEGCADDTGCTCEE